MGALGLGFANGPQMKISKNELALCNTVELEVLQLHSMQLYFFGIKNEMK